LSIFGSAVFGLAWLLGAAFAAAGCVEATVCAYAHWNAAPEAVASPGTKREVQRPHDPLQKAHNLAPALIKVGGLHPSGSLN
jgi:hypothetical protein